jgi:hypothetical protein
LSFLMLECLALHEFQPNVFGASVDEASNIVNEDLEL